MYETSTDLIFSCTSLRATLRGIQIAITIVFGAKCSVSAASGKKWQVEDGELAEGAKLRHVCMPLPAPHIMPAHITPAHTACTLAQPYPNLGMGLNEFAAVSAPVGFADV